MKKCVTLCLLVLPLALLTAKTKKDPREAIVQRVYMFGFAASFADSVAYMTDVQAIDSAYVYPNGFLADRTLYAAQLDAHLQQQLGKETMTCALFFNKEKRKLEKQYLKVRKRYREDRAVQLLFLGADVFRFKAEEFVPPMEYDLPKDAENNHPDGRLKGPKPPQRR